MGESKTNISLNIYTEPWIDANLINGHKERLSIRDCFVRAKEIYSLFIEDAQYALDNTVPYTMLTLILARTFMPGQDDKLEMLKEDGFDIESIDDYTLRIVLDGPARTQADSSGGCPFVVQKLKSRPHSGGCFYSCHRY